MALGLAYNERFGIAVRTHGSRCARPSLRPGRAGPRDRSGPAAVDVEDLDAWFRRRINPPRSRPLQRRDLTFTGAATRPRRRRRRVGPTQRDRAPIGADESAAPEDGPWLGLQRTIRDRCPDTRSRCARPSLRPGRAGPRDRSGPAAVDVQDLDAWFLRRINPPRSRPLQRRDLTFTGAATRPRRRRRRVGPTQRDRAPIGA